MHINPHIPPVAQPVRRIAFNMWEKVPRIIKEFIDLDIIEPVDGPTLWINTVVPVPKGDNDICLCIDMRHANVAIMRSRHPIHTVDEILKNIIGSKAISKLDLKLGYHQLESSLQSLGE